MPYTAEQLKLAKELAAIEIAKEQEYSKLSKFPNLKDAVRSKRAGGPAKRPVRLNEVTVEGSAFPPPQEEIKIEAGGDDLEYRFQRPKYFPTQDYPGQTGPMEYEGSDWYQNPVMEQDATSNPAAPDMEDRPIKQPKRGPRYLKERNVFAPLPKYRI